MTNTRERRFDKIESDLDMLKDVIQGIFRNGNNKSPEWIRQQIDEYVYDMEVFKSLPQKFQQRIYGYIDAFSDIYI